MVKQNIHLLNTDFLHQQLKDNLNNSYLKPRLKKENIGNSAMAL
ncbi:pemK phage domain protein [Streptococcus pneumoniae SPAR95]|nr:pemK phage domain protein [Streptococcus pneumoniae SPAR95]